MAGDVRFARMSNGREVGYSIGPETDGPVIVHITEGPYPLDLLPDDAMYERFLRTLGRAGRVLLFDRPGIGSSDPFDRNADLIEQTADAYPALLDAAGVDAAWIIGSTLPVLAKTIERHRERVIGAVLISPLSPQQLERVEDAAATRDRNARTFMHPSRADDPAYHDWANRALRLGASAADWADFVEAQGRALARFRAERRPVMHDCPMLLVRRRDALDAEAIAFWQTIFPTAEAVTIEGADAGVIALDAGLLAELAVEFITGSPTPDNTERRLRAVLFTDLVDSTPSVAAHGDTVWRSTLDRYEKEVRRLVERHHGSVIKHTGDGVLATLPSGTQAVNAAFAIRNATIDLGLEGRAGVHVGEVETRGDDIGGIAVHVAARVMSHAEPGQIVVTSTACESMIGGATRFEDLGEHDLKGVARPWRLWSATSGD